MSAVNGPTTKKTETLYTVNEVMDRYRIARSTLYGWINDGKFPPGFVIGKNTRRWTPQQLAEYEAGAGAS